MSKAVGRYMAYNPAFTVTFDQGDMFTVEAALTHFQAHCQKQLAEGAKAPFVAHNADVDRIRADLYRGMAGVPSPASGADVRGDPLPGFLFTAVFDLFDLAVLDKAFTLYRKHCKEEHARGAELPFWATDEYIMQIRKKF